MAKYKQFHVFVNDLELLEDLECLEEVRRSVDEGIDEDAKDDAET